MKRMLFSILASSLMLAACRPTPQPRSDRQDVQTNSPTEYPLIPVSGSIASPTFTSTSTTMPLPSITPSATSTPGPFIFQDDFSGSDQGHWSSLEHMARQDGSLLVGPFPPFQGGFNPQFTLCLACGERPFFRAAVAVTFESGQTDRFYGMYGPVVPGNGYNSIDHMYFFGISPLQAYEVRQYNLVEMNYQDTCKGPTLHDPQSLVHAGRLANHLEVVVKPSSEKGKSDLFFYINGSLVCTLYSQDEAPSRIGLGMDFHSQQVSYDDFQYEEILP